MPRADNACAAPLDIEVMTGPTRPRRPKTRPTMSVPAAAPMVKPPPGVGTWIRPMAMPTARPRASPPTLMSDMPRSLSPRYLPTSAILARGAMTRSRSPIASTKVSCATRSTSPRRTRLTVAPNFVVELELADGVADQRLVREGDPAEVEVVPVLDDVVRRHVAEAVSDVVEGGARADDGDEVVVSDRLGAGRHDRRVRRVGVLEPRDADLVVVGAGEHRHGHRLVDLDAHGDVADLLATRLRARAAQRPGRDDEHDDDATEVGDRVADRGCCRVGRAGRGRRERRGVGQRTGVGAGDGARLEAERAPDDHGDARRPGRAHRPRRASWASRGAARRRSGCPTRRRSCR